jgi:hypothetical protein
VRCSCTLEVAGQIAGDWDRNGQPIGCCDPMIAAIAISAVVPVPLDDLRT